MVEKWNKNLWYLCNLCDIEKSRMKICVICDICVTLRKVA